MKFFLLLFFNLGSYSGSQGNHILISSLYMPRIQLESTQRAQWERERKAAPSHYPWWWSQHSWLPPCLGSSEAEPEARELGRKCSQQKLVGKWGTQDKADESLSKDVVLGDSWWPHMGSLSKLHPRCPAWKLGLGLYNLSNSHSLAWSYLMGFGGDGRYDHPPSLVWRHQLWRRDNCDH